MKSLKITFLTGSVFVSFILVLGACQHLQSEPSATEDSRTVLSVGSKSKARALEDSKVESKVETVQNEPSALFNDPAIHQAWGLKKSDAARAWSVSKGDHNIIVAVIDTGADVKHEDLQANIWTNPGESGLDAKGRDKATNGIDDDGNGFVDDVHGWNFVSNDGILTDNHGHGTHICGIIGAQAGNGKGISGIAPEVSMMVLKYYDPKVPGTDNLKNTIAAIRYAVKMGAKIINYSGGGIEYSQEEKDAVAEAEKKNILFVAASGNKGANSDKFKFYPADYGLSNIISVTAINPDTEVLPSSNYGTTTVDVAAPGQNILSTFPDNSYGYLTGTSQATAFVTGAAVLVMARHESYKAEDVKKYILASGDAMESLSAKTKTSRRLNLYKALTILDQGVGLSGVIAENSDAYSSQFTAGVESKRPSDATSEVTNFGKALLKALNTSDPAARKPSNERR